MHMYRYIAYVFVLLLIGVRICSAEPSSTTLYLMNEQTSLFDFGLYKLENRLQIFFAGDQYITPSVVYDWNSNRIIIHVWNSNPSKFMTKIEAKNWCKVKICEIRNLLGIGCSTLKLLIPTEHSLVYQYFTHHGFKPQSEPTNLGGELDKIVTLSVGAYWGKNKNSEESKFIRSEVRLLGSEIMYSD